MDRAPVIGLDIGGRTIKHTMLTPAGNKYQASGGLVPSRYMELELEQIIKRFAAKIPEDVSGVGITSSYPISCTTYRKGIEKICNLVHSALPQKPVFFIDFEGRMWPLHKVMSVNPARFAMSNFYGSAYLGSKVCSTAVVMDTGSTSTDILLTADNHLNTIGKDTNTIRRNLTGEMTWTGIIATLISSLTEFVPLRGQFVKGSPRGGQTNDVYNILYYDKMRDLLHMYGVKQKERDEYYKGIAAYFAYDLENIEPVEIKNVARYVSIKHREIVAGFLLQVLSFYKLHVKDTNYVLMGIGKDILLKKVLALLNVDESCIFDAADYIPGDLWAHGSSVGAALRTLDHVTGEFIPLSDIKGDEIHG
ncbi:MAG: hypothetical protein HXS54_03930 [Theionarchaea archaeon]|nr:hypothetical protein [Theionarchaea archaeon]